MSAKKQLGQFFTTNTERILSGFEHFVKNKNVIDAFAGAGDLLNWAKKHNAKSIKGFDIDAKYIDNKTVFYNDSFKNPIKCDFVITNPPYLYQNKLEDNSILLNSKHTDLYQLALEKITDSKEGIIIVPINFLSAENSKYIRDIFLYRFNIIKANYFTERVFKDTTYNVIAFYYKLKNANDIQDKMTVDFNILPESRNIKMELFRKYNWQIGGEFLTPINQYSNPLNITRLEEEDLKFGNYKIKIAYNHLDTCKEFGVDKMTFDKIKNNIVILKAIDTGSDSGRICLDDIRKYNYDALVSVKTSRNQINLVFPKTVSVREQEKLIELFNNEIETKRNQYHSLFMTNYRDKNRKRISFNFTYNFINHLYFSRLKKGARNVLATQPSLF
jgi:predicted RNA methylase